MPLIWLLPVSGRQRWGFGKGKGEQEILPGREDQVLCDGAKAAEEAVPWSEPGAGLAPQGIGEIADSVYGKGQEIEAGEHAGQMDLAMAEIVLEGGCQ